MACHSLHGDSKRSRRLGSRPRTATALTIAYRVSRANITNLRTEGRVACLAVFADHRWDGDQDGYIMRILP